MLQKGDKFVMHNIGSPREGFQQTEQDHLQSKEKDKHRQTQQYFKIPEAKPLLTKLPIDHRKPKILIRDLKISLEYSQLLKATVLPYVVTLQKALRRQPLNGESTLWRKYVVSNNYKCLYIKYNPAKLQENDKRGRQLRGQLHRATFGNEWLLATYILDMSFLSETSSIMLRNLVPASLTHDRQQFQKQNQDIVFDSRFQNGNLMYAFAKIEPESHRQYHLILQNDINTKGYANWFYFKICSAQAGSIRLHLVNLQKNYSFFGQGMKPLVYSLRDGKGWRMQGANVSYSRNELLKNQQKQQKYHTLSFTVEQKLPNDILFVAATAPYTYSRLLQFLQSLQKQAKSISSLYFRRESLAHTISNNDCPLITLTWKRDRKQDKNRKKIVVIVARQHPLETVSSWVVEGLLSGLLKQKEQAQQLLRKYIFKVVPMVNIDGVIYGNSRCDISGSDCNRKWTKHSNPTLYPIVTAIKKLATEFIYEGQEVEYFFDLHGHSRKLGSFIYGCKTYDQVQTRIFAWLMSKITQKFSFQECRFGVSNFRKETSRGYMGGLLTNHKAMTLQTSFFGYRHGGEIKPFTPIQLRQLGQNLLSGIHKDTFRTNSATINWESLRKQIKQNIQQSKFHEQESQGSDSDPEGEQFTIKQKTDIFLPQTVASKIGLFDIKVVERSHKQSQNNLIQNRNKQKQLLSKQSFLPIDSPQMHKIVVSQSLSKNGGYILNGLRETKSVTKISSFKFRSVEKKSSKKIRIAIQVQRQELKEPRLSAPTLPSVQPRNSRQFWQKLKDQCQSLISQKKSLFMQAQAQSKQFAKQ